MTDDMVVALDSSSAAVDADGWAPAWNRHRGRPMVLLHGVDAHDADQAAPRYWPTGGSRTGQALLDLQRARLALIAPELDVRTKLVTGPIPDALIERTAQVAVLVLGSLGQAGFTTSEFGSIGHQVAAHARCPVIVVPPGSPKTSCGAVMVATGEPHAGAFAAGESAVTGSPVQAVDVTSLSEVDAAQELVAAGAHAGLIEIEW